ncbi:Phosphoribosylanthranilate isomerase TrpF [Methanonatronarchaeum thermophilum]|uniref:N-(5'-phosphoribosyl)anthranilate isomerase n=1 Tax=Methanonatronarchaeum thermophilum TaxID=1927129 RepID=A0A1Y3GJ47_9EURY|nr:phosphoribosylanthranilate isomerase [Methanonatronarchaeum thermophilum]OUJ19416.1 Phosphoribosylanthranilate isomerase TrpF [Methanonatronarchaeum thermophilum]
MRLKICGITQPKDALKAEEIGYDAIGVIVKTKSPRNISLNKAKQIFKTLGPYITKVCVTTTTKQQEIQEILKIKPDAIQLYTDPANHNIPNTKIIQAIKENKIQETTPSTKTNALLIDSSKGRGIKIDTTNLEPKINRINHPIIISGGLNPTNIDQIKHLNIYGVDVSSGLEEKPGIKNHIKMKKFHNKMRCKID